MKTRWLHIILLFSIAGIVLISGCAKETGKSVYMPSVAEEHVRGATDAKVTIVEYSDFQCPFCGKAQPTLEQILNNYEGKVKLVYNHFPLQFHQYAFKAAEASECAADQGKFWEYHDLLFKNQDALSTSNLKKYAAQLGLDTDSFNVCLDSGVMGERVKSNLNEGQKTGITGTPSFLINGQKIVGAQPYYVFQTVIDRMSG